MFNHNRRTEFVLLLFNISLRIEKSHFCIFTGRNEVVAKVIFLHLSVIYSVHRGGGLPQCMLGYQDAAPPGADTPPESRHPPEQTPHPRADTPQEQTPPLGLSTPPRLSTPPGQSTPPRLSAPPGTKYTPPGTKYTPPELSTPPNFFF